MACVTLKRPLEWVDPSMNADAGGPSSPKAMMIDHANATGRSPKRLRMQPTDSSAAGTSSAGSLFKPFTSHDLREQIAGELRKIKIARRNLTDKSSSAAAIPSSSINKNANMNRNSNNSNNNNSDDTLFGSKSPAHSDSSMGGASPARDEFDVPDTISHAPLLSHTLTTYNHFMMRRRKTNEFGTGAAHSGASATFVGHSDSENRPMFSFNQVVMIVERLLREKEDSIRQEYDQVLVNRLAEQYEQFVKFTYDQIQRNFDTHSTPSYLS